MRIQWLRPAPEHYERIKEECDRGETTLGGCMLSFPSLSWECGSCRHRWAVAEDPEQQAIWAFEDKIRNRRRPSV